MWLATPFGPALPWVSYLEVVEMDPAQVWSLFEYLQWLATFIDEFWILCKKEVVVSPCYKWGNRLREIYLASFAVEFKPGSLISQVQSVLFCIISCYHFKPGRGWENRLRLIYWRLWLPREAEQDFSAALSALESGVVCFHPISWGECEGARLSSWGGGAQVPWP